MIKESNHKKELINKPSVYVIDFGLVRKIGMSQDFNSRMASLSSQFKIKPIRYLSLESIDNISVERVIKKELKPFIVPFGGISTETFSTSFNDCARMIIKLVRKHQKTRILDERIFKELGL